MNKIKNLIKTKWKEITLYLIFGFLAFLVNFVVYKICLTIGFSYIIGNVIAWIISVLFAYTTNSLFVFKNSNLKTNKHFRPIISEIIKFYSSRLFSLLVEIFVISLLLFLNFDENISKLTGQVVITIMNFVISKFFIYKNKGKDT